MAQVIANQRDIEFVLYEMFQAETLSRHPRYKGFNRKAFDMIISEARRFSINEILPTFAEGDRIGARFENGEVKVPECFRRAFKLFVESEWCSLTEEVELGGQGLPFTVAQAASEYLVGANYAFSCYPTAGQGTGKMIELYGTEQQKNLFLKNLYTGRWTGTMLLTEPQAGSDVGALTTSAVKNADGTYSLTGNKIFITSGDHDLAENIIHPVLARIEGAPEGINGISIFIVPKFWVEDDGSLGERNDIVCTGLEEKMGFHGSATCSISLGSKGQCRGQLLGEKNKGMRVMFHMMNHARLQVGFQAFTNASAAYLYALNYATERIQGRDLEAPPDQAASSVPIIRHPDVRRMLLWMKSYVDGMRAFLYYVADCFDRETCADMDDERKHYKGLIDLLTPIVKAYCSHHGHEVCVQAMQVFGGYGYTKEYPVEQLARDCKLASIYEGTDGIQAMDLLRRKLGMDGGAIFKNFIHEIGKITALADDIEALSKLGEKVATAARLIEKIAIQLNSKLSESDIRTAFAFAHPFLDAMGDVTLAWMLLWRAVVADSQQKNAKNKGDISFYSGQLKTAEFFITSVLPITMGKLEAIQNFNASAIEISDNSF